HDGKNATGTTKPRRHVEEFSCFRGCIHGCDAAHDGRSASGTTTRTAPGPRSHESTNRKCFLLLRVFLLLFVFSWLHLFSSLPREVPESPRRAPEHELAFPRRPVREVIGDNAHRVRVPGREHAHGPVRP